MTTVLVGTKAAESTAAFVHHRAALLPDFLLSARSGDASGMSDLERIVDAAWGSATPSAEHRVHARGGRDAARRRWIAASARVAEKIEGWVVPSG
jgi:hypothetical protein